MSLLAPAFLFAIPLLAIPIVLHLLRKRQRKAVPWGAMQFLVNDDHRQRSFSNIDRWLVLLARCLILLFLIGALARPLMHSEKYGYLQNETDDILIIDQSISSSRYDSQGRPYIDSLRDRAIQWVKDRPGGANIRVLTTAGRPQWLTAQSTEDANPSSLIDRINSLRPVAAQSNLSAAIRFAATADLADDESETSAARRLWVLTDGQASDWNLDSDESINAFCDELERETAVEIHVGIGGAPKDTTNLGLTPLVANGWRKSPGERLRVTAQVVNYDQQRSPPSTAIWRLGDDIVARQEVFGLNPGEAKAIETHLVLRDPGNRVVTCELQLQDSLQGDNICQAVVEVLERIPVVLLSDQPTNSGRMSDADFIAAALGQQASHSETPTKTRSKASRGATDRIFEVARRKTTELNSKLLAQYDAVILGDSAGLSRQQLGQLVDYVERGGGLWLMLGDETDVETFNSEWYADGLGVSPVPLRELTIVPTGDEDEEDPDRRIHLPSREHSTVQWLSDAAQTDLDEVLLQRFYTVFRPDASSEARVLLRTGGGSPIAVLNNQGRGRVILQTLPMHPSWSNWPLTGSFVVMADSWMRHLTEPRRNVLNVSSGSPLRMRVPAEQTAPKMQIINPSGVKSEVVSVSRDNVRECRYSKTIESGIYTIKTRNSKAGNKPRFSEYHYSVARPVRESMVASVPNTLRKRLSEASNVSVFDLGADSTRWTGAGSGGNSAEDGEDNQALKLPIWTPLLFALLAFLLVEILLASFASIRRFGRWKNQEEEDESWMDSPTLDDLDSDTPPAPIHRPTVGAES